MRARKKSQDESVICKTWRGTLVTQVLLATDHGLFSNSLDEWNFSSSMRDKPPQRNLTSIVKLYLNLSTVGG
jgi:hypothetical protein